MTELARKILDELMGPDRNKLPSERHSRTIHYSAPEVCRHYLVDFCPHLQFLNTKSDIGPCPKKWHEEVLREAFLREASKAEREAYEREFLDYLEKLVGDLEKRLRRGRDRLEVKVHDPSVGANPENDALEEKRTLLDLQIKDCLKQIEQLAEEGQIQEAQELSTKVESMRLEVERLKTMETENPLYRLEKRMELCSTCGAFLIVGDAPKRIEAHYEGKQHNGWARVRQALEDYRKRYPSHRSSRDDSTYGNQSGYHGYGSSRDYHQRQQRDYPPRQQHGNYSDRRRRH